MSRTSHVPYHQNVYDLLQVETRPLPGAVDAIAAWEASERRRFPAAMAEWYASEGEIRCGANLQQLWRVSLVDLWSEFSNDEQSFSLAELFGSHNRPEHLWREPNGYHEEAYPHPFFRLIFENQGNWCLFAYADGSDDPPVFTTNGENGPWVSPLDLTPRKSGWQEIGPFSDILYRWFVPYYLGADFVPLSFNSYYAVRDDPAPPKLYCNGLWLRTPADPFQPPVIDFLTDQFGEPERTSRPGGVTTYTYRPEGGTIRVTADEPALTGALSAWWIHADTSERLAEFAELLRPWGTLRDTLRADTDPAREVLNRLKGERPV